MAIFTKIHTWILKFILDQKLLNKVQPKIIMYNCSILKKRHSRIYKKKTIRRRLKSLRQQCMLIVFGIKEQPNH